MASSQSLVTETPQADTETQRRESTLRYWLAIGIAGVAAVGILLLGVVIIVSAEPDDRSAEATKVLTATLPLLGSWVGTILAYYYSRENFEAATRSAERLTRLRTPEEQLRSVLVAEKMIAIDDMFFVSQSANPTLIDALKGLDAAAASKGALKWNRIPVLDDDRRPKYVIHRSTIDEFIRLKVVDEGKTQQDLTALTLNDLVSDDKFKAVLETSFAVVKEEATLSDAKKALDKQPNAQDVFVTANGSANESVKGWITNVIIEEVTRV